MPIPSYRFAAEVPLRWVDIDSWQVLNNAVYLTLIEQARYDYFAHLGLLRDGQVEFVLAEVRLRFLRPGRMGQRPMVGAKVTRLGRTSFDMEYEVRAGGETLATAQAVLVYIDRALQPAAIPAQTRATLARFEGIEPGPVTA